MNAYKLLVFIGINIKSFCQKEGINYQSLKSQASKDAIPAKTEKKLYELYSLNKGFISSRNYKYIKDMISGKYKHSRVYLKDNSQIVFFIKEGDSYLFGLISLAHSMNESSYYTKLHLDLMSSEHGRKVSQNLERFRYSAYIEDGLTATFGFNHLIDEML